MISLSGSQWAHRVPTSREDGGCTRDTSLPVGDWADSEVRVRVTWPLAGYATLLSGSHIFHCSADWQLRIF